jgi:hypothetical protein
MKQYYIISLKHTSRGDKALTFWRSNGKGYAWHRDQCGLYAEDVVNEYTSDDNVAVLKETADKLWCDADDHGEKYIALPNTTANRKKLGISNKLMKPARTATCRMIFVNSPVLTIVLLVLLFAACGPSKYLPCPGSVTKSGDTVIEWMNVSFRPKGFVFCQKALSVRVNGYCVTHLQGDGRPFKPPFHIGWCQGKDELLTAFLNERRAK